MNLQELKQKNPAELINEAEKLGIENPSTLRKQEILFAILKKLAEKNEQITATGVLEVLQDGFFYYHLRYCHVPGSRFIEGRGNNFSFYRSLHICYFLWSFIN